MKRVFALTLMKRTSVEYSYAYSFAFIQIRMRSVIFAYGSILCSSNEAYLQGKPKNVFPGRVKNFALRNE